MPYAVFFQELDLVIRQLIVLFNVHGTAVEHESEDVRQLTERFETANGRTACLAENYMDGAAVTITIFSLVAAFTTGVQVTVPLAVFLSIMATFSACGASGVAGGSLMLIPLGCSLFGISADIAMQLVGVGFIIGVIQDSLETALNSSGDVLFTATAEFKEWKKQGKKLPL